MKTANEVAQEVSRDLKKNGITIEEARKRLGYKTRQSVYNILSSDEYMKPEQARRFNEAFGYNKDYLLYGIGELVGPTFGAMSGNYYQVDSGVVSTLLNVAHKIIIATNDINAISAWSALMSGDHETFVYAIDQLKTVNNKPFLSYLLMEPFATDITRLARLNMDKEDLPGYIESDAPNRP